jgi:hypothetical protein
MDIFVVYRFICVSKSCCFDYGVTMFIDESLCQCSAQSLVIVNDQNTSIAASSLLPSGWEGADLSRTDSYLCVPIIG